MRLRIEHWLRRAWPAPLLGLILCHAQAEEKTEWRFNATLDGKPIGVHRYNLQKQGADTYLNSEADFNVTFLHLSLYRYRHTANEHWRDSCLVSLDARTDEKKIVSTVRGEQQADGFLLQDAVGTRKLPSTCISSFAYWNIELLQQKRLLNPQTGEWTPVSVEALGTDPIQSSKRTIAARRYRLQAGKQRIDLWYTADNQWVGLQSTTPDGRLITYQLIE